MALDSVNSTCMYSDVHSGVKCGSSSNGCQSKPGFMLSISVSDN